MADTAVATEAPAPATPATKKQARQSSGGAKKPKARPTHPKTSEMVNNAIKEMKERSGSSLQAIKKYIAAQYKVDAEKLAPFIRKYLKSAVESGALIQTKGKGASGSFKLESKSSASKKPSAPTGGAGKAAGAKGASAASKAGAKKATASAAGAKTKKASAAASASPSKSKAAASAKDKKAAAAAKKKPAAKKAAAAAAPAKGGKGAAPKAKKTAKPPTKKPKAPKPKKAAATPKSKTAGKKAAASKK